MKVVQTIDALPPFGEWVPQSGREPADSAGFEAYYNCPDTTPPEELLSEIFYPLK